MKKLTLFIISLTAIVSFSAFGSVKSLSSAWQTTRADGEVIDTITITCSRKQKKFFIQRSENSRTWCNEQFDVKCSSNKINIAKKLCSLSQKEIDAVVGIEAGVEAKVAEPVAEKAAEVEVKVEALDEVVDVSEQRKMDLQEQLILIEESRLNIQAKMLELEKAEIALRSN